MQKLKEIDSKKIEKMIKKHLDEIIDEITRAEMEAKYRLKKIFIH
jgi:hypothetical protein